MEGKERILLLHCKYFLKTYEKLSFYFVLLNSHIMSHLNFRNTVHLYKCSKLYFHFNLPLSGLKVFVPMPFFWVNIITLLESIFPDDDSNEDRYAVSHLASHLEHNHWSETKKVNCGTPEQYKPNKQRRYFQYNKFTRQPLQVGMLNRDKIVTLIALFEILAV